MEKYLKITFDKAIEAKNENEVPVGCVIVKEDKILSFGKNEQHTSGIITKHAEINAINDCCRKNGRYDLSGSTIYVTLEPCLMCFGAILEARIERIVYMIDSPKYGFKNHLNEKDYSDKIKIEKTGDKYDYSKIIKNFFLSKR